MLIPLSKLYAKYKIKASGIVHIGANAGQEFREYARFGLRDQIWIEADPDIYTKLIANIGNQPGVRCINACISDVTGEKVTFHVANNDGQSSSILELGTHATVHPEVKYIREFEVTTIRMDDLFSGLTGISMMAIDVQGNELRVLKGMGRLLDGINYIYAECNRDFLYKGCPLVEELDEFLFDFKRVETQWAGNTGWGDCFFIRK